MSDAPKTMREMAAEAAAMSNGGFVCPKCGGALVAYKTITLDTRKIRYRRCRNVNCEGRFVTKQQIEPCEEIMREIGGEVSKLGKPALTILRHVG